MARAVTEISADCQVKGGGFGCAVSTAHITSTAEVCHVQFARLHSFPLALSHLGNRSVRLGANIFGNFSGCPLHILLLKSCFRACLDALHIPLFCRPVKRLLYDKIAPEADAFCRLLL